MDEKTNIKDPQIYISKDARKLYDNIKSQLEEFKDMENKDFFILAVVFGYLNKKRKKLDRSDRTESGFSRERYLSPQDNGILKAIAISEEDNMDLVNDIVKVYSIAEEYANGGIDFLKEFIFDNPASFTKNFASELKNL